MIVKFQSLAKILSAFTELHISGLLVGRVVGWRVGGPVAVVHHLNSCPLLDYFVTPFEPLTVLLAAKCDNLDRFFMSLNSLCSWD